VKAAQIILGGVGLAVAGIGTALFAEGQANLSKPKGDLLPEVSRNERNAGIGMVVVGAAATVGAVAWAASKP
jgi:hypothetical protein